ncbi:Hamartin protein-domain-containing protein [Ampelomyces quisqualis]|uniref:Hamartin protein-domain-containing protein n=1 Tax=Ampelomyces quisqualis TaxID=50730 RepID=A0A6A5QYS5_AMPQU|nr:Hamartin protein-domain-containing protein [Ampelomyces quisqualis]
MSAGGMRETVKALTAAFAAPTAPCPLPDELRTTIDDFLERYDHIDDHDSQRFHHDLHALYQRHVAASPEKHGAFLAVLRLVRPAITGEARLTVWWTLVLKPTLDGTGYRRQDIEHARELAQSILVYDAEADKDGEHAHLSQLFTKRLLDAYLARTNVHLSPDDAISPENELIAQELEAVLVAFGQKMPKALLLALDELFVQKQYRMQALNLLSAFVRLQPPHLHLVLETPLIQHLEKCLLIDASSTVIDLALVVLIMFLPHICASLTLDHHLPKMFLIYSRLLCWDTLGSAEETKGDEHPNHVDEESDQESDNQERESEQAWEPVQQSTEYPDSSPPTLLHCFTFLYGLFPLNLMSFVRKPRKFLKSLNFPGAGDFDLDQDLIQSRTEPYRRLHLLHPNMFTTTVEDELRDNRWLKSDPADVVTECMDLCVAVSSSLQDPGPPPNAALPAIPVPPIPEGPTQFSLEHAGFAIDESNGSWRNTQSTVFVSPSEGPDVPQTFEIPPRSKSAKSSKSASPLLRAHDVLDSPTLPPVDAKKLNLSAAPAATAQNSIVRQPSLDNFVQSVTSNTTLRNEARTQTMASLQREMMLLRNDLNFERYLKLQHLAHIGQLQRKHMKEATADAETQNLINTNKTLKARLAKAIDMYAQLKKETLTSRNQSKKWESDLSARVRTYKESEKTWHSEEDSLRYELERTQSDYDHLKQIVEKAEAEQIRAQQRTRALEYELEDYSIMQRDLEAAQAKILALEDQRKELHTLIQERNNLRNDLEMTNMRLNSRDLERERSIKAHERRIMELETRLQMAERNTGRPGQLPSSVQQMLDSALAASHAKLQQLKKTHYYLLEQHTELQMKYHNLEAEHQAEQGRYHSQGKSGHLDFEKSRLGRTSSMSVRQPSNYNSRYLPPLATEIPPSEERDHFHDYQSPNSVVSPISNPSPARPVRNEPTQRPPQRSQTNPSPYTGLGGGLGPDFSSAYDASLNAQFQSQAQNITAQSSGKSSYSVDTEGSAGKERKEKIEPKSEVRYCGRGGAQNISKKKEKDQKKPGSSKTGGFRGLKGIM